MAEPAWGDELPLTTVESFVAALVEAGPEVAEHMVKAANELLLAAQAITAAAERRLAEQRRLRDEAEARAAAEAAAAPNPDASAAAPGEPDDGTTHADPERGPRLHSVDEVA